MASAGAANVKRHHMLNLQCNKLIVGDGLAEKAEVCGSISISWRGLPVQSNHAAVLRGERDRHSGMAFPTVVPRR